METITIAGKKIGKGHPCFIIAEVGVNHNGELALAKKLVDIASSCGADAVKFQKRDVDSILTAEAQAKPYGGPHSFGETYGEHRRRLELDEKAFRILKRHCAQRNISFLSSGWDRKSVDFLAAIGVQAFKIASADLTDIPFLQYVARKRRPIILSTGMADMCEVTAAVRAIRKNNDALIVMQCTSAYPCRFEDINLNVMKTYQKKFGPLVGYSGHEQGIAITVAAVAMGACAVERHFTIDRTMKGPDHAASLEPQGLYKLVRDIRAYEKALGSGEKRCLAVERPVREKLAKSLVAAVRIPRGARITRAMLTEKSPGSGIAPYLIDTIVGRRAKEMIERDMTIARGMIL